MPSALVVVYSAVLAAAGIVILRQGSRLGAYERRHAEDVRALEQLRPSARKPAQEALKPAAASPPAPLPQPHRQAAATGSSVRAPSDAEVQRLQRELDAAHGDVSLLQDRLRSSAEEKQNALAAAASDFQIREREWQGRVDALQRQLDSARAEADAARERAAALAADNSRAASENSAAASRVAELRDALARLQDLDRRRDAYLSSILRRYRDITDQFRSMAAALDSSRTPDASPASGLALSRIQNAIMLAESDLRRVGEINAQAHLVENKLAKK